MVKKTDQMAKLIQSILLGVNTQRPEVRTTRKTTSPLLEVPELVEFDGPSVQTMVPWPNYKKPKHSIAFNVSGITFGPMWERVDHISWEDCSTPRCLKSTGVPPNDLCKTNPCGGIHW
jgi:hypothetical protein